MDNAQIDKSFFDRLTDSSFQYLSEYYRQTERHANRAFLAALILAIFGGIVVTAGVVAAFLGVGDASYVALGCGVIVQFISAVMFTLYYKTVANMKKYHNDLVMTLDLAIALKTADSLENTSDEAKTFVIQSLMEVIKQRNGSPNELDLSNRR